MVLLAPVSYGVDLWLAWLTAYRIAWYFLSGKIRTSSGGIRDQKRRAPFRPKRSRGKALAVMGRPTTYTGSSPEAAAGCCEVDPPVPWLPKWVKHDPTGRARVEYLGFAEGLGCEREGEKASPLPGWANLEGK